MFSNASGFFGRGMGMFGLDGRIFYHVSRGGIEMPVRPISRPTSSFGRGFYISTDSINARCLVGDTYDAVEYAFEFNKECFSGLSFISFSPVQWACTVISNMNRAFSFCEHDVSRLVPEEYEDFDIVVAPSADDWMRFAIRGFAEGSLTDEGLKACLDIVPHETHVICKSEDACSALRLVMERNIELDEIGCVNDFYRSKMREVKSLVEAIAEEYRDQGSILSELLGA